ncbi:phage tail protein [Leptospira bouyouniensis]|uniref:Phage tail protein n=1 Tax=Leptospira bouyouniensis TaxID=2484911 RepID=A0A7I0HS52_9LEPT|nr:phage tail protein [Leptospira bouyouniensis]TGL06507.1 phage tail protein [Leptospira bouyouniensis]
MTPVMEIIKNYPSSYLNQNEDSDTGKRWQIIAPEFQEINAAIETLYFLKDFSRQSGRILDLIGQNVRQKRNGLDDEKFKIFLSIANSKRQSKGDIYSLNEIGNRIVAGSGNLFEIRELCYLEGTRFLDGSILLNGEVPLSGSLKQPATIEIVLNGRINDLKVISEFNQAIADIRAGGVEAIISYRFEIYLSEMLKFNFRNIEFDGSWPLDGSSLFSGDRVEIIPFEIAVGTGAEPGGNLREPEFEDTGLQTEVLRKLCAIRRTSEGLQEFSMKIKTGEAIGDSINEIGIFRESGEPFALFSFPGKPKDGYINYEFVIREGL